MYDNRIIKFIRKKKLIEKNDHIVIGVSGGPDSMCLLHYLLELKEVYNLKISVAHINHHTRGEENILEENLIKDYCKINNLRIFVENFYKQTKMNFHEEARNFRYQFFVNVANEVNANKIVLAHHQDDQIETIIFRLIRGNTLAGYTGIEDKYRINKHITVVRPFLNVTKAEILQYCDEYKIPYRIDSSNLNDDYSRNKIRNLVIPVLNEIQPNLNQKVLQFREQIDEVNELLTLNVSNYYNEVIEINNENCITINIKRLKRIHKSVIRLIILKIVNELTNNTLEFSYEKVNNIIDIIYNKKPNINYDIGLNYYCIKAYDFLTFQKGLKEIDEYSIIMDEFKEYTLPNKMKINAKIIQEKAKINSKSLILCYNSTMWPLVVRTKNNGDTIKTNIGTKKVNRVFIDAKVPVNQRKSWPIITDQNNQVLWVVGLQKALINMSDKRCQYIQIDVKL